MLKWWDMLITKKSPKVFKKLMIGIYDFSKKAILLAIIIFLATIKPIECISAEILNITNSQSVEIGDQNRNIRVNLFCIDVEDKDELAAINLLKKNFPRGTKVKIQMFGKENENLLAKIYSLKTNYEMTDLLFSNNLTRNNCEN